MAIDNVTNILQTLPTKTIPPHLLSRERFSGLTRRVGAQCKIQLGVQPTPRLEPLHQLLRQFMSCNFSTIQENILVQYLFSKLCVAYKDVLDSYCKN